MEKGRGNTFRLQVVAPQVGKVYNAIFLLRAPREPFCGVRVVPADAVLCDEWKAVPPSELDPDVEFDDEHDLPALFLWLFPAAAERAVGPDFARLECGHEHLGQEWVAQRDH